MSKTKTVYVCQNCGGKSPKWIGKCPYCNEWNTYVEEIEQIQHPKHQTHTQSKIQKATPQLISQITSSEDVRVDMLNNEFNRVLGGGLVSGSLVLIGGEPGIGKSTLILQIALNQHKLKTLYVSGEESAQQIKLRADRISQNSSNCYILSETLLENILLQVEEMNPDLVVIDSIQTIFSDKIESSPGSVSQVRECTSIIQRYAKETNTAFIIIGHINKEGNIAGPKALEHIVDTVLQFEGDTNYLYRILRSAKNRFGSTSEIGIFEMQNTGLREVLNPSELLLSHSDEQLSGVAISSTIEGIRPFLIEVQSLVSTAAYGIPQRSSTGFDLRRLSMLLAVLEKRAGFRLSTKDVFLNIAGGIKVDDPAIDMAVICAVLSSNHDLFIPRTVCFSGEVGLTGEIRPVTRIEQRIGEAQKLGFEEIYISKYNRKGIDFSKYEIKIHFIGKVDELFRRLFGK